MTERENSPLKILNLRDKTVIITGAAQGIGKEAALMLSQKGAIVHIIDCDSSLLEKMALAHGDRGFVFHCADVSQEEEIATVFDRISPIHVLINNAGIQKESSFENIEVAEWRRTIDVNLTGTFLCIRAALPKMSEGDTILNVLTHQGRRTNLYPYAASKAAIHNLTQNLAIDLGERKISINGLAFGAVFSQRNAHWQDNPDKRKDAFARTPLGFMLEAKEVAWQMVNFIEQSSLYATGTVFDISGGRSLR